MTDRPAAPERDRFDLQAERELPHSQLKDVQRAYEGDHDHYGMEMIHGCDEDCPAYYRPTYAAGLRKAYSEGQSKAPTAKGYGRTIQHQETDGKVGQAMKEATNMGAERGPSREAIDWAVHAAKAEPPSMRLMVYGFDAGREAAMARTCEWSQISPTSYKTGCERIRKHWDSLAPYCDNCGGRIVVAAQDRG